MGTWTTDEELAAIRTRTTVVAHELDPWHAGPTAAMAQSLHARIPNSTLTALKGVGSLVLLEDPGYFLDEVMPILKGER